MNKRETQLNFVRNRLLENGKISRNECLQNFISRLGSRIYDLEQEGFSFRREYVKENGGRNYYYYLERSPYHKVKYFVPALNKEIVKYERN